MYELLILAQLMCAPEHGYQIAKIASDMIGPWAKISLGTLYPLLAKLEQSGFIKKLDEGQEATTRQRGRKPSRTTYEITPAGRMRFHQLMIDTISNPGDYQRQFRLKVLYLDFLQPDERLHILNHYITYCETLVLYLRSEMRDLLQVASDPAQMHKFSPHFRAISARLMRHQAEQWEGEIVWAKEIREHVIHQDEAEKHVDPVDGEKGEMLPD